MSDVGVIINLDDQEIEQSKAVLDYTSRDFSAIRTQLVGLARGLMPEWETAGESPDFGTLILELFAYMGDVMHFYIDRTASEAFLGTAIRRQSILYIADMMGYTPVGQQAASVKLTFGLEADDPESPGTVVPVTIPKGTRVYNSSNNADTVVIFEMETQVILQPGDTGIVGYAAEGITMSGVFMGTAQGIPNTEFVIQDKGVIYNTVVVNTAEGGQSVDWTFVTHLADARPTQAVFTTFMDDTGLTHIVFGDNASGRIPPVNAKMYVTYRFGVGAAANALAANAVDTIANVPNVDLFAVTVTNPEAPVGGSDPESIDSMRYSVSRGGSRIRSRAVTLNDYADLALQVPGVVKAVAYGSVYTAVHVKIAPSEGKANVDYMERLCNVVVDYMSDKIMIGSTVYAEPQDVEDLWQNIYIHVLVHVQEAYNRTSVRLQVDAVVRSLLAFNNVDFGTRISIGLIYRAVLAVQGVEYAELEWLNTDEPVDDTNPGQGDTLVSIAAVWQHSGTLTMADPGTKHYRRNNATNPTAFAFSATDDSNTVRDLTQVHVGDHIVYRPIQDVASWMSFTVTAAPVNNTTWYQIAVAKVDEATSITAPGNNDKVMFSVIRYTPTPDSLGGVIDIDTDELLIPRIAPPITLQPVATVTNRVLASNVTTLTTASNHGLTVGEMVNVAGIPAVNEVQTVTPTGTISGGTFTLTLLGVTTAAIVWNASAATIQSAINTAIPGNTVTVTGGPVNTTAFTLLYTGYGDVAQATIASSLTGTSPLLTVTTTAQGVLATVFNGTRLLLTTVTANTLSYAKTNVDVPTAAAGGTVTQIDPARPESDTDYPDMTEDERTHDGLWVKADGGMANT